MKQTKFTVLVLSVSLVLSTTGAFADGKTFLRKCLNAEQFLALEKMQETTSDLDAAFCVGMIQGVNNTMILLNNSIDIIYRACWPKGGITNEQGVRIVVKYLKENPNILHQHEVALIMLAFLEAFRCSNQYR